MAEVGHRLGTGACLLSALRTGPSRPVGTGGGPGCLLVASASPQSPPTERPVRGLRGDPPESESRAATREAGKLSSTGRSESQLGGGVFLCAASLEPRFIGAEETRESLRTLRAASQPPSPRAGPVPSGRPALWSTGGVSIHPDPFRSPQQPRAFCTVVFVVAPRRPGCGLRRLQLHPDALKASAGSRSYSWSSEDAPPAHRRSRTAYYDILSVSPSATQSQIKTAYYKQSFIYHPDKNPGSKEATQRFSEVSEAYSVLGNISLRRKYDRGILSQADIQSAGRPSSKVSRSPGSSQQQQQQQQQQQRARQFSQAGGRPMFDFDAFYQAHYGEQLQRERELRARKQQLEEMQKKRQSRWREQKMMELTLTLVVAMGGLMFLSICKP